MADFNRRGALAGAAGLAVAIAARAEAKPESIVFDALGEMRVSYDMALVDRIIASGTRGVAVTLTDPKVAEAEAFARFQADLRAHDAYYARHPDRFVRARSVADLETAARTGRIAVFYNLQDSAPAGRAPRGVARLRELGVTSVQLTYNTTNAAGSGCFEPVDHGLTPFGRDLIRWMEAERILLDVSHAGMRTMAEAVAHARRPPIVSHTACRALRPHRRNTTDENMRAVAAKGGLVGITQIRTFLTDAKRDNLEAYFNHLAHAVNVIGVEHVYIGSDRDHRVVPDTAEERRTLLREEGSQIQPDDWPLYLEWLNGPHRMTVIRQELDRRGMAAVDIDKIMGGNLVRLYREVVG